MENAKWEERWKVTLQNDFDDDGEFLIKLIVKKLELMKGAYQTTIDEMLEDMVSPVEIADLKHQQYTIDKCLKLGIKIMNYPYGAAADAYENKYNIDTVENYKVWDKFVDTAVEERKRDVRKLFTILGENVLDWWV